MPVDARDVTQLERDLANRILAFARREALPAGAHLREEPLSLSFGVSRTPVRGALGYLEREGYVERVAHRGFFLRVNGSELAEVATEESGRKRETIYQAIISDYIDGSLKDRVSEASLLRRYGADRAEMAEALALLSAERIIRASPGYGWQFDDLLRTAGANEESQRFRLVLEPAGLRQPTFRIDEEKLLACRAGQVRILESVGEATPASEIFAASTWFHELLAGLSGNRFILQAIEQQSRLRRLVDYRSYDTPDRVKGFYREHIAMIDLVLARRLEEAAVLMEKHISDVVHFKPAALGDGKGEEE